MKPFVIPVLQSGTTDEQAGTLSGLVFVNPKSRIDIQPSFLEFERSAGVEPLRGGFAPTPPCSQIGCERYNLTGFDITRPDSI